MKLKNIFLCEAASVHPDNTFSVLKGGINRLTVANLNYPVKVALVATIELGISERGRLHTAEISLLDMDGKRILPSMQVHFQPPVGNIVHQYNLIAELFIKFPVFGEYCFYVNVDGQELGTHSLFVVQSSTPAV